MVPALNEEEAIGDVIDTVPWRELADEGFATEVLVVDGRSEDGTAVIAKSRGAKVLSQNGKGKGLGVRQALSLSHPQQVVMNVLSAREGVDVAVDTMRSFLDSKFVVMIDADGTYPAEHIVDVVRALDKGNDVVMGSRFLGEIAEGAMTKLNYFGNLVLSTTASVMYLHPVSDLCTGLWGFRTTALRTLALDSKGFELEAEIFAQAVKSGLRIAEVPIGYYSRKGETKLVPIKSGVTIMKKLVQRRVLDAIDGMPRLGDGDDLVALPTLH
ncbi:MAG: glycosyltransferase family 2 protein [Methanomassiliicoccales archaeon]|nr:glycosyltransferase family 2 protein [Methanomassiliicoccales archaeon]